MKVSVIIPTHNRPSQLQRAYDSVCTQTFTPEEIIIIDDASEIKVADSLKVAKERQIKTIIKRFSTVQGACKARNQGVAIAGGDIIMFLDDDDTWEQKKISNQLQIFASNSQIGLVYSGKLIVNEAARDKVLYKVIPTAKGMLYPKILYDNLIGSTSSVAIKKQVFHQVGGFDEKLPALQDYDLWIRCCQKTVIAHDHSYNLRYTLAEKPHHQITGQVHRQIEAVKILLEKYHAEISHQGFFNRRKICAAKYFYIGKSLRSQSLLATLPWIVKSLLQYPNLKVMALILPQKITLKLRQLFHKLIYLFVQNLLRQPTL